MSALSQFAKYLIVPETIAAITGCLTWKKWKQSYLKWFVIYLHVIVVCEICNRLDFIQNNASVANVFKYVVPIEVLFINWFFSKAFVFNKRVLIFIGLILYILSWIAENTFLTGTGYFFKSLSYTLGNLFISIYVILFFVEFVKSDKILGYKKMAVFWIVLGMLLFYLGTFPFYGLYNEIVKNRTLFRSVAWVAISLDYCMYLLFTIGFIWGKPHS